MSDITIECLLKHFDFSINIKVFPPGVFKTTNLRELRKLWVTNNLIDRDGIYPNFNDDGEPGLWAAINLPDASGNINSNTIEHKQKTTTLFMRGRTVWAVYHFFRRLDLTLKNWEFITDLN